MRYLGFSAVAAALACAAATIPVAGMYMIPETKQVPVERLVKNLERALVADPKNVQVRINLARLHGMAYALKTEEVTATRWHNNPDDEPYYGHGHDLIPYKNTRASTPEAEARARDHLKKAIAIYAEALAIEPKNLLARLGYGWMLDQAGEKAGAIAEYRQVVKQAWLTEETAQRNLPEHRFYTHEAAGYLIPLLDSTRDAGEIADLKVKRKLIDDKPARAITPLAIPLADNVPPHAIPALDARVRFDADGSGLRRHWTWISPDAGWLVHDPRGTGEITSALQWFGSVTFWLFWENGYQALASLDDDANEELTGDELRNLAIWHDRNSNGISDPGEVRPLSTHGIVALSCRHVAGDRLEHDRLLFAAMSSDGVRLADGRRRPTYDVMLRPVDLLTMTRPPGWHVIGP